MPKCSPMRSRAWPSVTGGDLHAGSRARMCSRSCASVGSPGAGATTAASPATPPPPSRLRLRVSLPACLSVSAPPDPLASATSPKASRTRSWSAGGSCDMPRTSAPAPAGTSVGPSARTQRTWCHATKE
eukprot:scaffold78382_cov63-Phaeocystis_antarctica.AAC.1